MVPFEPCRWRYDNKGRGMIGALIAILAPVVVIVIIALVVLMLTE